MKYTVDTKDKVVVVSTKIEKLDAVHAPELKSEIVMLNKTGHKNIVLDMSETRYIDSSGSDSYTHIRAHETVLDIVCRLLPE